MAYLYSRCGVDIRRSTPVATNSKIEQSQSATSNNGISVVYSENKVDPSESSHFHFKDNTERSIDLVKIFEAKYRECFCNHLTQLITDLENSTSIDHIVDACNCFNNNISNSTYNNTSLNGVTLSVDANIDFENSKNNLITDSKNLLASYQVTVLEKQEKTEPNIELKENNAFFRFFNSVIKLLTKFINFFQQGHMLNKLNDVIDKKKSLNETELANLINQLNQTSLDKALLYSTQQGNVEILNMLVQAKANVNTQNEQHGDTPLILAAEQGNVEIIDLLVKAGANINATNKYNETALNVAIWWHRYDFAKKLLEYQPDVNTTDIKGCTALILATSRVLNNNSNDDILYEIIDEIIDKSSNEALNLQNYRGYNALHGAVSRGNLYAVKKLLKREVLVNDTFKFIFNDNNQGSALHLIIGMYDIDINKKLEIIKLLLDAGIDTNIKDSESRTALELAKLKVRSSQNQLIVELLQKNSRHNKLNDVIDKKENLNETEVTNLINKLSPDSLDTALIYSAEKGNVEILNRLIAAGANINAQNERGFTPLIIAAAQGNIEIIDILVKAEANINTKNEYNSTALIKAIAMGEYAAAKKLLEHQPDINVATIEGCTALMFAVGKKLNNDSGDDILYDITDTIIDDSSIEALNIQDNKGNTALLFALSYGNLHVVKKLLEKNVSVNGNCITDSYNNLGSGLHVTMNPNNIIDIDKKLEIIKLLLDAGIDTNIKDGNDRNALEFAKLQARNHPEYTQIVEVLKCHIQN